METKQKGMILILSGPALFLCCRELVWLAMPLLLETRSAKLSDKDAFKALLGKR